MSIPCDATAVAKDYVTTIQGLIGALDQTALCSAVERLRTARDDGATVFFCGNGGSAATASHLANDFGKAVKQSGTRPMRVMCLSDNISWVTALANDEGYDQVFAGQLENFAVADDVLVVISASGSSPNLVAAVEWAQEHGLVTIGLLGFDGGLLKEQVDELLWVDTPKGMYGPVESAHSILGDILTTCLMQDRPAVATAS
jgi:D-sedoheptulose 7-phosphate isomerase